MNTIQAKDTTGALRKLTEELILLMERKGDLPFYLALSGAGTAQKMYRLWVTEYANEIHWDNLRFFWVDERCVDPTDEESNFGHAHNALFAPLQIPESQVFRIMGERNAALEAVRYSRLVEENLPAYKGKPLFDCIILGVGEDLHTASIFPNATDLLFDERSYAVSHHPVTGQYRITMTGTLILNHVPLLVPVVGEGKAPVVEALQRRQDSPYLMPAPYILSHAEQATLYVEK